MLSFIIGSLFWLLYGFLNCFFLLVSFRYLSLNRLSFFSNYLGSLCLMCGFLRRSILYWLGRFMVRFFNWDYFSYNWLSNFDWCYWSSL